MQRQSSYKVHMNTISNGELSDPLCDSVNRGLTLVRLIFFLSCNLKKTVWCKYTMEIHFNNSLKKSLSPLSALYKDHTQICFVTEE